MPGHLVCLLLNIDLLTNYHPEIHSIFNCMRTNGFLPALYNGPVAIPAITGKTNSPAATFQSSPVIALRKPALNNSVLLVSDNQKTLDFISNNLQEDYTVFVVKNGKEALEIIRRQSIQLIVSDINMPLMNGFDFCSQLKSSVHHSHIPIVLLTGGNDLQERIEVLRLGADAYMEKPILPEHLRAQIKSLLTNRIKIKEYFAQAHMSTMVYSKSDEHFVEKLNDIIFSNIENPYLHVDLLARLMNMSRPTLYRKIKDISELTPNELVTVARLKKAAELLTAGNYKVFEVATMVGFNSQSSFGKAFLKQFKATPTQFKKRIVNASFSG